MAAAGSDSYLIPGLRVAVQDVTAFAFSPNQLWLDGNGEPELLYETPCTGGKAAGMFAAL
jgi:hypothetical protein